MSRKSERCSAGREYIFQQERKSTHAVAVCGLVVLLNCLDDHGGYDARSMESRRVRSSATTSRLSIQVCNLTMWFLVSDISMKLEFEMPGCVNRPRGVGV